MSQGRGLPWEPAFDSDRDGDLVYRVKTDALQASEESSSLSFSTGFTNTSGSATVLRNTTPMPEIRQLVDYSCQKCSRPFRARKPIRGRHQRFCSHECASAAAGDSITTSCGWCGNPITRSRSKILKTKSGLNFCNRVCKEKAQAARIPGVTPTHYDTGSGKHDYRTRALSHYGKLCSNPACPITTARIEIPDFMLHVHHVSRDRSDNELPNLKVLCIWCHALEHGNAFI